VVQVVRHNQAILGFRRREAEMATAMAAVNQVSLVATDIKL
jgi:hypothetical protein